MNEFIAQDNGEEKGKELVYISSGMKIAAQWP